MSFRDTLVGGSVFALFIYRICASEGEMAAGEKPDRARGRNGKGPVRRHEESRKHTTAHSFATRNCAPPLPHPRPSLLLRGPNRVGRFIDFGVRRDKNNGKLISSIFRGKFR